MAFAVRRIFRPPVLSVAALLLAPVLRAQVPEPLATVPDPARVPPAEVAFVNPLWQPLDSQAKPTGPPPKLRDLEATATLVVAVRIDEAGRVSAAAAAEPPLRALGASAQAQASRWTFKPAKKDGLAVRCWGTYGVELEVQLEDAAWSSFRLAPVGREDPLPALARELPGETWMSRYPAAVTPPEPGVLSVEEVDYLPMPARTPLKVDSTPLKSRLLALVEVLDSGAVGRIVPVDPYEPLVLRWVRENAAGWTLAAARRGGAAVPSWLALDATIEYVLDSVKERGKRSIKKNVRGVPQP